MSIFSTLSTLDTGLALLSLAAWTAGLSIGLWFGRRGV